ncbi:hypothetical protein [Caballeronia sp. BR00000012568055]|uniref:hypothetical protein n=1 Tax=Caballeronia sp. BR00000012568055 TaxID=2918761 RepID=UPI0023F678EF|nr:hypothetical protein [Caballeronia sp. BR00000012568055]
MRARLGVWVSAAVVCFIVHADATAETEQAQQRQTARGVRQDTRQHARQTKQNCVVSNQQSNASCRQDKRGTKQQGREVARDIKY